MHYHDALLSPAEEAQGAAQAQAYRITRALERNLTEGARDALASDLARLSLAVASLEVEGAQA